jgi:hypothetical protein
MKIVEFFLIIWGKCFELDPEPEFLTSWSRSRTKMDRLCNTVCMSNDNDTGKFLTYEILTNTGTGNR